MDKTLDILTSYPVQPTQFNRITFSLVPHSITYSNAIHPTVDQFMKNAKQSFTPEAIAILSNSVGTEDDVNFAGAELTELEMGIPVIRHKLKKPACLDEVSAILFCNLVFLLALSFVAQCTMQERISMDISYEYLTSINILFLDRWWSTLRKAPGIKLKPRRYV